MKKRTVPQIASDTGTWIGVIGTTLVLSIIQVSPLTSNSFPHPPAHPKTNLNTPSTEPWASHVHAHRPHPATSDTTTHSTHEVSYDAKNNRLVITYENQGEVSHSSMPLQEGLLHLAALRESSPHPQVKKRHIPEKYPLFLDKLVRMAGLDPDKYPEHRLPNLSKKIPFLAADMRARALNAPKNYDPIEQVQFLVLNPGEYRVTTQGLQNGFSGFVARTKSGKFIRSKLLELDASRFDLGNLDMESLTGASIIAPDASSIRVSTDGTATIQFMGLGVAPDFSITYNPEQPEDAHMEVMESGKPTVHYKLHIPPHAQDASAWIVAYQNEEERSWSPLFSRGF